MSAVLTSNDKVAAVRAWHEVFVSTDPFGWPFSSALDFGRILFPIDGCHLSREQFDAIAQVAAISGETHCYLAVIEGSASSGVTTDDDIFLINLADYDGYAGLHLTLENAIYSLSGTWGLLLSHEMHAVLGGSSDVVSTFNRFNGPGADEWRDFQAQWKAEEHAKWLAEIAQHLQDGSGGTGGN